MVINKILYFILLIILFSLSIFATPVTEDTSYDPILVAGGKSDTLPTEPELIPTLSSYDPNPNTADIEPKIKTDQSFIKSMLNFFFNLIGIERETNEPIDTPSTIGSSSQTESSPENLIEIPVESASPTTGSSETEIENKCPKDSNNNFRGDYLLKKDFTLPENTDTITIIPGDGLTSEQVDKTWAELVGESLARISLMQQDKFTITLPPENNTVTLTPENFQIINGTTTESIDIKVEENKEQNEKTLFAYPKIGPLYSFGGKKTANDKKTTIKDGYGTFDLDLTTPDGATGIIKIKINLEKTTGSSGTENSINIKADGNKVTLDGMNIAELHGTFVGSNLMVTSSLGEGKTGS